MLLLGGYFLYVYLVTFLLVRHWTRTLLHASLTLGPMVLLITLSYFPRKKPALTWM